MENMNNQYQFGVDWFSHNQDSLELIFNDIKPTRVLEIGSFEGRSTVFFLETILQQGAEIAEIHCVDTWLGGIEHHDFDMYSVEQRFDANMQKVLNKFGEEKLRIVKYKNYSDKIMVQLLAQGYAGYFDFVYIDGSHQAPDVLFDALLAHRLVKVGGVIAFDDYLWHQEEKGKQNHYNLLKPAVDHYINTYQRKVHVVQKLPLYQLYVLKIAD